MLWCALNHGGLCGRSDVGCDREARATGLGVCNEEAHSIALGIRMKTTDCNRLAGRLSTALGVRRI
jgi:hypothetical protein